MRVHRVHLAELTAGEHVLTGSDALHLSRVLRVNPGARVRAFNGRGLEAEGVITEVAAVRVALQLEEPEASVVEAALRVTVAIPLLKGNKLVDVVRQCTELGAAHFILLRTRRSDLKDLSAAKLERLQRVAREAAKQSGRSVIPTVAAPIPLPELLQQLPAGGRALQADPQAVRTLNEIQAGAEHGGEQLIVTGPEGGLAPEEREMLQQAGVQAVKLGRRVLRAETAPVALLAALLLPEAL